ncbi:MAG TPA: peptidylprolyl isomerase, partial [Candidatus Dormibacteraeota bacterium]|nr:peptidylprolyl isomerase [Candidatus Dormibacteraeota bacterium]
DPIKTARMKDQIAQVRKANLARLEQPERVRISHIFMVTRDRKTDEPLSEEQKKFKRLQLERIRKRALEGEDFSKLVMEYSEDRGLKETKGEYTFSRTERFAPESPEFKAAAFSLEPGKISDIVTTSGGMHVVKLLERIPAKKVEFEKIAPELKEFLVQQEVQRAIPDFFARLNKEAQIEMLDPKYRLATATATVGDMEPPKKP